MGTTNSKGNVGAALTVSPNGRYLLGKDGEPFFWLGDTAWLLFQMPNREEAELYFRTRARQGFTVIQAGMVMGEERVCGTLVPNAYGKLAFVDGDPLRPDLGPVEASKDAPAASYWDHVDYVIDRAAANGLILGVVPLFVASKGDGYKHLNSKNAYAYGQFLGRRYRAKSNIIWVLGGDNTPGDDEKRAVWDRMAKGIAEGVSGAEDYSKTLMTYHINGRHSSSEWLHGSPWLDLNMIQTWDDYSLIYHMVSKDYGLKPTKPVVLAEGAYEDGPQYPTGPIDARVIRMQAYWSYFAGGFHTFGNTNTWCFGTFKLHATQDWREALDSPGARGMAVLRSFFNELEWWKLVPDQSIFAEGEGSARRPNAAMRSIEGGWALVYLAAPATVALHLSKIASGRVHATWVDPRTGEKVEGGEHPAEPVSFSPPAGWEDALLVLRG